MISAEVRVSITNNRFSKSTFLHLEQLTDLRRLQGTADSLSYLSHARWVRQQLTRPIQMEAFSLRSVVTPHERF